ncbi:hypothetical protein Trydic_g5992 [Trypoxylus dichotomus]
MTKAKVTFFEHKQLKKKANCKCAAWDKIWRKIESREQTLFADAFCIRANKHNSPPDDGFHLREIPNARFRGSERQTLGNEPGPTRRGWLAGCRDGRPLIDHSTSRATPTPPSTFRTQQRQQSTAAPRPPPSNFALLGQTQPSNQNGKRRFQKSIKASERCVGPGPLRSRSIVMV